MLRALTALFLTIFFLPALFAQGADCPQNYRYTFSWSQAQGCDFLFAIGTTLSVFPIANVVPVAKQAGARIVILNAEPTEMDFLADGVLRAPIGEVLPKICAAD